MMRLPVWLIKIGFHLLYYQMAWIYDIVAWSVSFGQWATWRRLALSYLRQGTVLEVAYGTGGFFVDLLEAGYQPVGIDLSPYMARIAGRKLRRGKYAGRLNRARAQKLPFPTNYFDNVVATFPSDYMLQDQTLAEIYRVLRSGGWLIIVAEGELRGPWPVRSIVDWLYRITDQHSLLPAKPLQLLKDHRLKAKWLIVEQDGARARLLIGEKSTAN